MGVEDASDSRLTQLSSWVREDLGFEGGAIAPASADASFRRYFRVTRGADSFIVMDAPPDKEALGPFLHVARLLADLDLNVPTILARDEQRGFLLLTDLGTRQYLDALQAPGAAEHLYADALQALRVLQSADLSAAAGLPRYDGELLNREMSLMPEWFLRRHLAIEPDPSESAMLQQTFWALTQAAVEQPQCLVHRDYHSRNLLVTEENNPGILDFQDAVVGPVTYDPASLLKDCYIAWPVAQVREWALQHRERLLSAGVALPGGPAQFLRWFDLIGLQRHIKVLGIFARLFYRDGKPQYLDDLPRVLAYVKETAHAYGETAQFARFIDERIEGPFQISRP